MDSWKFDIAGVQHHNYRDVLNILQKDLELNLVPEPTNQYDSNAVRIEFEKTMLGYVPKKFSAEVAAAIEVYVDVKCKITSFEKTAKPWNMIEVEIRTSECEKVEE